MLQEIHVPFQAVEKSYPANIADITELLHKSRAEEAKTEEIKLNDKKERQGMGVFKWFFIYEQPNDPDTKDENEFVDFLKKNTKVYLLARGFKWRGQSELKILPKQVLDRYIDRARRIIAQRKLTLETHDVITKKSNDNDNFIDDMRDLLIHIVAIQNKHNSKNNCLDIARFAIQTAVESC